MLDTVVDNWRHYIGGSNQPINTNKFETLNQQEKNFVFNSQVSTGNTESLLAHNLQPLWQRQWEYYTCHTPM